MPIGTSIFSDNFNSYADGSDLDTQGNWKKVGDVAYTSTLKVANPTASAGSLYGYYANGASGSLITDAVAYGHTVQMVRNTGTYSNDQYAEVTLGGLGIADPTYGAGVVLRSDGGVDGSRNLYMVFVADGVTKTVVCAKYVAGTASVIGSNTSQSWSNGDKIGAKIAGTTITLYKNTVATAVTWTDSSHSTGRPGIFLAGLHTATPLLTVDDFDGGDAAAAQSQAPRSMHQFRLRAA